MKKKTPRIDAHGYTGGSLAWEPGSLHPTYADSKQAEAAYLANERAVRRLAEPEATAP